MTYPCSALYKPSDFLQNLLDVDFEPIVSIAAIWYISPICIKFVQAV